MRSSFLFKYNISFYLSCGCRGSSILNIFLQQIIVLIDTGSPWITVEISCPTSHGTDEYHHEYLSWDALRSYVVVPVAHCGQNFPHGLYPVYWPRQGWLIIVQFVSEFFDVVPGCPQHKDHACLNQEINYAKLYFS